MTEDTLLRLAAVAAILGGGLRVLDALLNNTDVHVQQIAYFITDLMLIFGFCGIYLSRSNCLGIAGFLGFVFSITGLLLVRSFGQGAYLIGASVTLLGMVVDRLLDPWIDRTHFQNQLGLHSCWRHIRAGIHRRRDKPKAPSCITGLI